MKTDPPTMSKAQKHIVKLAIAELKACEDMTEYDFFATLPDVKETAQKMWPEMRGRIAEYRAKVLSVLEHLKALT